MNAKLGEPRRLDADGTWWFGYQHARDIPDELFLEAMRVASVERAAEMGWPKPLAANRWDVASVLATGHIQDFDAETPGVATKLVRAKAKRLIDRRVIKGCPCECRGDYEVIGGTPT